MAGRQTNGELLESEDQKKGGENNKNPKRKNKLKFCKSIIVKFFRLPTF